MIERLFVYGTLAPGKPNEHYLKEIGGTWQSATVTGALHPEGWGATMGYPAIILSESGDEVHGQLFSSDNLSENWAALDEFEGEAYERIVARVRLKDGSAIDAYVYALKNEQAGLSRVPPVR